MRRIQSYGSSVNYLVKILQLKGEKIVNSRSTKVKNGKFDLLRHMPQHETAIITQTCKCPRVRSAPFCRVNTVLVLCPHLDKGNLRIGCRYFLTFSTATSNSNSIKAFQWAKAKQLETKSYSRPTDLNKTILQLAALLPLHQMTTGFA